jgi:hypothetical protein
VRQDVIDAAGLTVWTRVQGGEPFTMALCREAATELDKPAYANSVYRQVQQWREGIDHTRRLSRR